MINNNRRFKTEIILLLLAAIISSLSDCSKNPSTENSDKIEGRWVEVYKCNNAACDYARDSLLASVCTFNRKNFTTAFYRDSLQTILDTTFSGRYSLSNDTLRFSLDNFSEIFYFNLLNNNHLYLEALYSIDSGDNTIIDFHSILWCCDKKKRGIFEKY